MVFDNNFSDYGSGENSSSNSSMSFGRNERWSSYQPQWPLLKPLPKKSLSFVDLEMGRCTLDDVMQEFRMNGSDTPYTPDEDKVWSHRADDLIGMGPSGTYLRQKSWPDPERTPAVKLPRPASEWLAPTSMELTPTPAKVPSPEKPAAKVEQITEEQVRVLSSLPNDVLYSLLRGLELGRGDQKPAKGKRHPEECRFCKNNGERESYYRSHTLKDADGRVSCPVLRAFVCKRCGASGDRAHTIKYCPFSTNEERIKSAAMMRSVRMASGRRRAQPSPYSDYVVFGEASPTLLQDNALVYGEAAPLDPRWAALEQKLML